VNGFNKIQILGNTGNAPETKDTRNGAILVTFSLATTRQWKDKNSGETRKDTTWIPCTAFGRTAEIIQKYVGKGTPLYIEGHWQNDQYEKNGEKRTYTKCIVDSVQLLPSGKREESTQGNGGYQQSRSAATQRKPEHSDAYEEDFPLDFDALERDVAGVGDDVDVPF
jgi:single-strand DNA-binding protein